MSCCAFQGNGSEIVPVASLPLALQQIFRGAGSPEGVVTAPVGSIYERSDGSFGTALYVKQTGAGNTGWFALVGLNGEPVVAGDFALGAQWGVGATLVLDANFRNTVRHFRFTVTAAGVPAVNATVTLTFPLRPDRPFGWAQQNGGSGATATAFWNMTTTTWVLTRGTLAIAGLTYAYEGWVIE